MKLKTFFASMALVCLGASCADHPLLTNADDGEFPADSGYVSIDLRANNQLSRLAKGHDPLQSVQRITCLFYHPTEPTLLFVRNLEPSDALSFDLKIPKQDCRLVVLTNVGNSYANAIPNILDKSAAIQASSEALFESFVFAENGNIPSGAQHAITMANDQGTIPISSDQIVSDKAGLTGQNKLTVHVEPCLARVFVVGKPTVQGGSYVADSTRYIIDVVAAKVHPLRHLSKLVGGVQDEQANDNSSPADRYASSWAEEQIAEGITPNNVYGYAPADLFSNQVAAVKMQEKKVDFDLNRAGIYVKETSVSPQHYFTAFVPRVLLRVMYTPNGIPGVKPEEGWVEFQGRKMSLEKFKHYVVHPDQAGTALAESIKKAKEDNALIYTKGFSSHGIQFYYKSQNYYAIPIRHFDNEKAPNKDSYGRFGLIRNNEYVLTVKSITGAGSPVIPAVSVTEPVEREGFVSMGISVNQTTEHGQDVDL